MKLQKDNDMMKMFAAAIPERTKVWNEMLSTMKQEPLWENGTPNFKPDIEQKQPSLYILPKREGKPRGAVIVCAGGAYLFKSNNEGKPVAEKFYNAGLGAAVLDYRVTPYTQFDAMDDAKRAVRYLRYHADQYNILPDKIAILGFSAGGNLTGMTATVFDYGNAQSEDPIERISSRPDAAIQCYGSFSWAAFPDAAPGFSSAEQIEKVKISPDKHVTSDCPPFFLFQTQADDPRGILNMSKELTDHGVKYELHIFPEGPHGSALFDGKHEYSPLFAHTARWSDLAIEWMEGLGF